MITVTDPVRLESLKASLSQGNYWAKKAPAITAFLANADWSMKMDSGRDLAWFELGMAAMNYQLQAVKEGLHVHPIVGFNAAAAKLALGVPEAVTLEVLVVLAYPGPAAGLNERHLAAETAPRSRRPLEAVYAANAWDDRLLPAPKA
ncbi:MAG: nitroreductase [Spirochaetes bacterium]|nr:MAG: nitroreductase [Spirochaetota bacterium]